MKWLEMIQLRTSGVNRRQISSRLHELIHESGKGNEKHIVLVYSRALIDTDYCIHILHDSNKVENLGSPIGLQLVTELKEFGLVNHSVWNEIRH